MKLMYAQIENFRSIENLHFDLEEGCQILIGINESGKSNILRALQLVDQSASVSRADLRVERNEEDPVNNGRVRFVFELSPAEVTTVFDSVKKHFEASSISQPVLAYRGSPIKLFDFCHRRNQGLHNVSVPDGARITTYWALPKDDFQEIDGWRQSKSDSVLTIMTVDGKEMSVPPRGFVFAKSFAANDEAQLEPFTVAKLTELVGRTVKNLISSSLPKCIFWRYSDQYLLPASINIDAFCADPNSCIPLRSMFELAGYPANEIAEKIGASRTHSQHRYLKILERVSTAASKHIAQTWKEHKGVRIELRPNGDVLIPVVIDDEVPLDMASRSDGFKRFVSFLLQVSAKVKTAEISNNLLLVDEPEVALHPGGARSLMSELIRIGKTNKVVYSTHSIFMIDRDNIARHLVVEKHDEVTVAYRAEKSRIQDEEVLYGAVGYSLFETLREKNVVFEGWRDKEVFRIAMEAMSKKDKAIRNSFQKIGMTFAEGVKDVKSVARFLELASRPCLIISDADKAAIEKRKEYQKVGAWGHWLTLSDILKSSSYVTAEDLISREAVLRRVNKITGKYEQLPNLSVEALSTGSGTINSIERWLRTNGLESHRIEAAITEIKDALYTHLKREELVDAVDELVHFVLHTDHLNRLNPD